MMLSKLAFSFKKLFIEFSLEIEFVEKNSKSE